MHGQHQSCIGCELKGSARPTTGDPDFLLSTEVALKGGPGGPSRPRARRHQAWGLPSALWPRSQTPPGPYAHAFTEA